MFLVPLRIFRRRSDAGAAALFQFSIFNFQFQSPISQLDTGIVPVSPANCQLPTASCQLPTDKRPCSAAF
jgi:hypothetical protein